jgi:hypothetical protein
MMSRILSTQWAMPADVPISPECRDLLSRLLEPEPAKRITMAQISQHQWFLQNLPPVSCARYDDVTSATVAQPAAAGETRCCGACLSCCGHERCMCGQCLHERRCVSGVVAALGVHRPQHVANSGFTTVDHCVNCLMACKALK